MSAVGAAGSAEVPARVPGEGAAEGPAFAHGGGAGEITEPMRAPMAVGKASPATPSLAPGQQPSAPVTTAEGNMSSLPFMVPTQDEVDAMITAGSKVSALMAWAEVDPDLGAHFLTKELGVGAEDHWGVMAGFQLDELNDLLNTMKFKGESLKLGVKG